MGASASAGANDAVGNSPGVMAFQRACPIQATPRHGNSGLVEWTKCSGVCDQRDPENLAQVMREDDEVLVEPVSVLGELRFLPSPCSVNDSASPLKKIIAGSEPTAILPRSPSQDSMAVNFSPRRSSSQLFCPPPLSPEPVVASEGALGLLPAWEAGSLASPGRPLGPGSAFTPPAVAVLPMSPVAAVATPPAAAPVLAVRTPPPAVAIATSPQQRSPYRGGVLSLFTPSPATPPVRRGPFDMAGALPEGVNLQDLSEEAQLELAIAVSLQEAPPARGVAAKPLRPAETCHAAHAAQLCPAQPAQQVCLSI
mmetsp:Transcript_4826/g.8243  ORF Transcript_4826/g.8243 Transcript_4826/m.8243 type:complete len:311 (-) Transcript_4826:131-1063(-)